MTLAVHYHGRRRLVETTFRSLHLGAGGWTNRPVCTLSQIQSDLRVRRNFRPVTSMLRWPTLDHRPVDETGAVDVGRQSRQAVGGNRVGLRNLRAKRIVVELAGCPTFSTKTFRE